MELSAPVQRPLPSPSSLGHRRPFLPTTASSSLLFFSRSFPVPAPKKKPFSSRVITVVGRSGARFRRAAAFEEEDFSFTAVATDKGDDAAAAQKRVEGSSFTMVSPAEDGSSGGEDSDNDGGQSEAGEDLLSKFNLQLDFDNAPTILTFGSGALLALWLSSYVVSALDSVPVFPKLMEVVGLGFTIWFSSRYLIFKKDRDELFAKLQALKEEVLGTE